MRRLLATSCFALVVVAVGVAAVAGSGVEPADGGSATSYVRPLVFESNQGQTAAAIEYAGRSGAGTLYLTRDAAVLARATFEVERENGAVVSVRPTDEVAVTMRWLGGSDEAIPRGVDPLDSHSTYFRGADDIGTARRIRAEHYGAVRYEAVYEGVDLVFRGDEQSFEYDFIVAPGADASAIRLQFQGAEQLSIDESGDLLMDVGGQVLVQRAPVVFQDVRGSDGTETRHAIEGEFVLAAPDQVEFAIGAYDHRLPLVIDPKIKYSTYLGGGSSDSAEEVVEDGRGTVYVAGWTCSAGFPTESALQGAMAGVCDAFVAAFNARGQLLSSTFFGGSGVDLANSIHVASPDLAREDGSRAGPYVYVTGQTASADFPVENPIQTPSGDTDVWVSVFTADLDQLLFSTALGGVGLDFANDIITNAHGYIVITGGTESKDFPQVKPTQKKFFKTRDAFVAMLNPALGGGAATLEFSTFLGGKGSETGYGVALSDTGAARGAVDECITAAGITDSIKKFPTVRALQKKLGGEVDAFLAKWCNVLAKPKLVYSSYYGGSEDDFAHDLVHDSADRAVIVMETHSDDLPVTADAIQGSHAGNGDAALAVFDLSRLAVRAANGGWDYRARAKMVFATYHGGSELDRGNGVAVDRDDNAHIAGLTWSSDLPVVKPLHDYRGAGDVLVAKIDYGADSLRRGRMATPKLLFSSPLGGTQGDVAVGICVDRRSTEYVVGLSFSSNYPTKKPVQRNNAAPPDAIVTAIRR